MDEYYMNQAGSGIAGFQGVRYQKGNGFMGRVINGALMPILRKVLPFLGKTALAAGSNIIQDFENGTPISESARKRLKETKAEIRKKSLEKFKELTGGRRKQTNKRRPKKKPKKKQRRVKKRTPAKKKKTTKRKTAIDFL